MFVSSLSPTAMTNSEQLSPVYCRSVVCPSIWCPPEPPDPPDPPDRLRYRTDLLTLHLWYRCHWRVIFPSSPSQTPASPQDPSQPSTGAQSRASNPAQAIASFPSPSRSIKLIPSTIYLLLADVTVVPSSSSPANPSLPPPISFMPPSLFRSSTLLCCLHPKRKPYYHLKNLHSWAWPILLFGSCGPIRTYDYYSSLPIKGFIRATVIVSTNTGGRGSYLKSKLQLQMTKLKFSGFAMKNALMHLKLASDSPSIILCDDLSKLSFITFNFSCCSFQGWFNSLVCLMVK